MSTGAQSKHNLTIKCAPFPVQGRMYYHNPKTRCRMPKFPPFPLARALPFPSKRWKHTMQSFLDISFVSSLSKSFLPARLMCKVIFYLTYLWFSEAQVYCNMPNLCRNIDWTGEPCQIHEWLTPLKIWQRSLRDQAGLIKAALYYSP